MSEVFLKIVNMSICGGWLVLAVLALRFVLKRAPKWVSVLLWGIVAARLVCPFSIESALSLIPSAETISPEIMLDRTPEISTGIASLDRVVNPVISTSFAPEPIASANPLQIVIPVAANLWLLGVVVILAYTAISYLILRRKLRMAVIVRDNIFQCETVRSPFVLGILKPKIYLPYTLSGEALTHVVAHEHAHISRKDHWWKPLGFLLLTLHWFNPLMWVAYILLCRDIELACDEKVIARLGGAQRADYTQALVACSVNRFHVAACPLAFGEVGVKERVKSILNYRRPAFWIIVTAIILCGVVAICFLTDPVSSVRNPWVQEYVPGAEGIRGEVDTDKYESVSEDFAIGADKYGRAVFKDPHKAFETLRLLYADGIAQIQEEFHLPPLIPATAGLYKTYGWQTSANSTEASFVSGFLDIYENSFTSDIPPAIDAPPTVSVTSIVDRTVTERLPTDEAIEVFYEDAQYVYSFPSIRSHLVMVTYSDGGSEDIKTALDAGRAEIRDLDRLLLR